jgi:hypothetical protein
VSPDTPQFSTAEYTEQTGPGISVPESCRACGTPLATEYYRVRGQAACASCAATARNAAQTGASAADQAAFLRALLLGLVAAIAGLIAYAAFTIATGFYVGYVALGVGYLVAKAMKIGSGGLGGRPYQIAAVALTYLSIALAEIPIGLWHYQSRVPVSRLLAAGLQLLPVGLAAPFLEMRNPVHGVIGLVILIVGLRIAWRGTAAEPTVVEGPFRLTPAVR